MFPPLSFHSVRNVFAFRWPPCVPYHSATSPLLLCCGQCHVQVRKGRPKTTRPVMNNRNPTWQEDFDFILDDPVGNFANPCCYVVGRTT